MSKDLNDLFRDFRAAEYAHEKTIEQLPRIVGSILVKEGKNNFNLQGYKIGTSVIPWKNRKAETNKAYARRGKTYKGSVFSPDAKLLMQTMNMYENFRYWIKKNSVEVGWDLSIVPYAKAHNEGENHEPRRQVMPAPGEPMPPQITKAIFDKITSQNAVNMQKFRP